MEAYFDNSAATRVPDSVRDVVVKVVAEDCDNPSAKHKKSMGAEWYVHQAAVDIVKTLKIKDKEVLFTSGDTESSNMVLTDTAMAGQRVGRHIISTRTEHVSVYNPLTFLEQQGSKVTYLSMDHKGHISLEELERSVHPDTILASIMYVNNEMGAIESVNKIAVLIHGEDPNTLFRVDAIQAYGKLAIRPVEQGIDLLSVNAHEIHGPRGIGLPYIALGIGVCPLLYGGDQQKNMRSGMEDVPGAVGMGTVAKEMYTDHRVKMDYIIGLEGHMIHRMERLGGITVNSLRGRESTPQTVSANFEGVRDEVLLHVLEDRGVCVPSGSACSSSHPAISGTLKTIGVEKELLDSTLRSNFRMFNIIEEVDCCIGILEEILPALRRCR